MVAGSRFSDAAFCHRPFTYLGGGELVETQTNKQQQGGVVYQTVCQNPGCAHSFELRITPQNASVLSGTMACPRCHRHGGMLKPAGRVRDKVFAAKLMFKGVGSVGAAAGPAEDGDLLSDLAGSGY